MSTSRRRKRSTDYTGSSSEGSPSGCGLPKPDMDSEDDDEVDCLQRNLPTLSTTPVNHGSQFFRNAGSTHHSKPAELFRKDLISAMKLPDSEPLQDGSYLFISDPWRQDWERGVQVPVNVDSLLTVDVRELYPRVKAGDFKIPHKLLHERVDALYKKGLHELSGMAQLTELVIRYDLDDCDVCWLEDVNVFRREIGVQPLSEWDMECLMEAFENQCHKKLTRLMKTEEGLGIEYDEDIVCDVCHSPDGEDTNELVFCDGCDICVHQACYGIQSIPDGSWLCRPCALGIKKLTCLLCSEVGGAMKSTRSGTKWIHVSCALWVPEVSIADADKMEPIININLIPPSRWALVCEFCRERVGACIQCSVKTCKTAFHVTCGLTNGLYMRTLADDAPDCEGVNFKALCSKHTRRREWVLSDNESDNGQEKDELTTPKKELSKQEKRNLRIKKLKNLEEEFYAVVNTGDISSNLKLDVDVVDLVYVFWKLRRKVRNLCYMISKREKTKRSVLRSKQHVFVGLVRVLLDKHMSLTYPEVDNLRAQYHFNSPYDDYGRCVVNLPEETFTDSDGNDGASVRDMTSNISSPNVTTDTICLPFDKVESSERSNRVGICPSGDFANQTDCNKSHVSRRRSDRMHCAVRKCCHDETRRITKRRHHNRLYPVEECQPEAQSRHSDVWRTLKRRGHRKNEASLVKPKINKRKPVSDSPYSADNSHSDSCSLAENSTSRVRLADDMSYDTSVTHRRARSVAGDDGLSSVQRRIRCQRAGRLPSSKDSASAATTSADPCYGEGDCTSSERGHQAPSLQVNSTVKSHTAMRSRRKKLERVKVKGSLHVDTNVKSTCLSNCVHVVSGDSLQSEDSAVSLAGDKCPEHDLGGSDKNTGTVPEVQLTSLAQTPAVVQHGIAMDRTGTSSYSCVERSSGEFRVVEASLSLDATEGHSKRNRFPDLALNSANKVPLDMPGTAGVSHRKRIRRRRDIQSESDRDGKFQLMTIDRESKALTAPPGQPDIINHREADCLPITQSAHNRPGDPLLPEFFDDDSSQRGQCERQGVIEPEEKGKYCKGHKNGAASVGGPLDGPSPDQQLITRAGGLCSAPQTPLHCDGVGIGLEEVACRTGRVGEVIRGMVRKVWKEVVCEKTDRIDIRRVDPCPKETDSTFNGSGNSPCDTSHHSSIKSIPLKPDQLSHVEGKFWNDNASTTNSSIDLDKTRQNAMSPVNQQVSRTSNHKKAEECKTSNHKKAEECKTSNHKKAEECKTSNHKKAEECKTSNHKKAEECKTSNHKKAEECKIYNHKQAEECKTSNHKKAEECRTSNHKQEEVSRTSNHKEEDVSRTSNHKEEDVSRTSNHKQEEECWISNHKQADECWTSNHKQAEECWTSNHKQVEECCLHLKGSGRVSGERSNIFEYLERQYQEGDAILPDTPTHPENLDTVWHCSDWRLKFAGVVTSGACDHRKPVESKGHRSDDGGLIFEQDLSARAGSGGVVQDDASRCRSASASLVNSPQSSPLPSAENGTNSPRRLRWRSRCQQGERSAPTDHDALMERGHLREDCGVRRSQSRKCVKEGQVSRRHNAASTGNTRPGSRERCTVSTARATGLPSNTQQPGTARATGREISGAKRGGSVGGWQLEGFNKLLKSSDLIIDITKDDTLRRVERMMLTSFRSTHRHSQPSRTLNERTQQLDNFLEKVNRNKVASSQKTSGSPLESRVLNEITQAGKGNSLGKESKHFFSLPPGRLGGYKIPKKARYVLDVEKPQSNQGSPRSQFLGHSPKQACFRPHADEPLMGQHSSSPDAETLPSSNYKRMVVLDHLSPHSDHHGVDSSPHHSHSPSNKTDWRKQGSHHVTETLKHGEKIIDENPCSPFCPHTPKDRRRHLTRHALLPPAQFPS